MIVHAVAVLPMVAMTPWCAVLLAATVRPSLARGRWPFDQVVLSLPCRRLGTRST
jgi:hypothetical protein